MFWLIDHVCEAKVRSCELALRDTVCGFRVVSLDIFNDIYVTIWEGVGFDPFYWVSLVDAAKCFGAEFSCMRDR